MVECLECCKTKKKPTLADFEKFLGPEIEVVNLDENTPDAESEPYEEYPTPINYDTLEKRIEKAIRLCGTYGATPYIHSGDTKPHQFKCHRFRDKQCSLCFNDRRINQLLPRLFP